MPKPLIIEIKFLLTSILNNKDRGLRMGTLSDVMKLLDELQMDSTKAEEAIKVLENKDDKRADRLIEEILKDVDKNEYGK